MGKCILKDIKKDIYDYLNEKEAYKYPPSKNIIKIEKVFDITKDEATLVYKIWRKKFMAGDSF